MQLYEKIPNNVNLSHDKRLLRALEKWKAFRFRPMKGAQELRRFVLTRFNEEGVYKASNPVVSDDGKFIAFQVPRLDQIAGDDTIQLDTVYDPAQDPVLRIGLSGSATLVQLRNVADDVLKKEIEALTGVAAARVSGGLEEEIRVEVDEARLAALGLPIGLVTETLRQENINASGGSLRDRNAEYIVRTLSRFEDVADIADVTVAVVADRSATPAWVANTASAPAGSALTTKP